MLSATNFVLGGMIVQPIFSLFLASRGASLVQIGLLLSMQSFIPLVLRIPLSVFAERVGRSKVLLAGLFITFTSTVLYAFTENYMQVLLVAVYASIAQSSFNQTAMSTMSDMAPPEKQGDALGRYLTFLAIGMLIGPALCSILVGRLSYRQLFLVSSVFPLMGLGLGAFWASEVPRAKSVKERASEIGVMDSLRMIFRNRNVMLLSYCRTSFSTSQSMFIALFSIYAVQQLGISESTVALLFTIRGLANTVARFPAGWISDRIGRRVPLLVAYSLLGVSFSVIALTESVYMLGFALALYGLCWGTRASSEWAFLTDLVEPEIKTISISYLSSVFGLGGTLGSVLAGWLTVFFPYSYIFLLGAALNLGSVPAVLAMGKRKEV